MKLLEETLFLCNKVVVYLEQARDIYGMEPKNAGAGPASATAGGASTSTAGGNTGRKERLKNAGMEGLDNEETRN